MRIRPGPTRRGVMAFRTVKAIDADDAFVQSDLQVHLSEEGETIYRSQNSKEVHRTKCQAPKLTR